MKFAIAAIATFYIVAGFASVDTVKTLNTKHIAAIELASK